MRVNYSHIPYALNIKNFILIQLMLEEYNIVVHIRVHIFKYDTLLLNYHIRKCQQTFTEPTVYISQIMNMHMEWTEH